MQPYDIFVQSLGVLALIFYVISYQIKKPALFYLFCFAGSTAFCIHFLLLGSIGGFICNIISMLKTLYLWLWGKKCRMLHFYVFIVLFTAFSIVSLALKWDSWLAIFTLIASLAHTYMFFQKNPKMLRYIQIIVVSPMWLLYNTLNNVSIGGILTESFVVASSIVYLIRHKKDSINEPSYKEIN